jgi:hypothetical protein
MRTPEVITGARAPRSDRDAEIAARRSTGANPVTPEGFITFRAIAASYRVQLTAPEDLRLGDGRILRGEKPLVAVFKNYFLHLNPEKEEDMKKIDLLMNHSHFGIDFFDFAEEQKARKKEKAKEVVEMLADPEGKAAIMEALRASGEVDFELPKQ